MWNSPLPKNTIKIHIHVGQFSQQTNWKLVEVLQYNQGLEEWSTWNQVGRQEKWSGQDLCPREVTQNKGRLHGDPPRGVNGSSHILGTPVLESDTRKTSPVSWFEISGTYWKARLCLWRAHAHACLLQGTVRRKQIENCLRLWLVSCNHPSVHPSLHQASAPAALALLLLSTGAEKLLPRRVHTLKENGYKTLRGKHRQNTFWHK